MIKFVALIGLSIITLACEDTKTQIGFKNQLNGIKIESITIDGIQVANSIWPGGEDGQTYDGSDNEIFDKRAPLKIKLTGAIGEIFVITVDTFDFEYKNDTTIIIGDSTRFRNNM